tara:strand:+ start:213 stop:1031 length:819 start_codon:yes stop_codon:yes gene_type:complete
MILVTGGCSFSEPISPWITTWPKHLENHINPTSSHHTGMGSAGNGMISRSVIHKVSQLLKENNAKDLLVGIMWSGPDRHEVFVDKKDITESITHGMLIPGENGKSLGVYNPYNFINEDNEQAWLLLHPHNSGDTRSEAWYKHLHNKVGAYINTIEHILRTQWFLKSHSIKYFMTTYTGEVLPKTLPIKNFFKTQSNLLPELLSENKHTKHLYEQIDFAQFLPVEGEYEWCRDKSGLEFPIKNDNHPSSDQHLLFTKEVIVPFCNLSVKAQIT